MIQPDQAAHLALLIEANTDPLSREGARRRAAGLLASAGHPWFSLTRFSNEEITIQICGEINGAHSEILTLLEKYTGHRIVLELDSHGGEMLAAKTVAVAVARHGDVLAVVHRAFSAALLITCAARRVLVCKNGSGMMVHSARHSANYATATELRRIADELEEHSRHYARALARRIGRDLAKKFTGDDLDHYLTPDECVNTGLADEVTDYNVQFPPRRAIKSDANLALVFAQALNRLYLDGEELATLRPYLTHFQPPGTQQGPPMGPESTSANPNHP